MNLKGLIHRELGEGLTEKELASSVGVVPGTRTFALKVEDDSMQPLFSEGEIIFVNPDLSGEPNDYVLVESGDGSPEEALLRQLKEIGGQTILHPLNRQYEDIPMTNQQHIWGRVVRLRKNL